MRFRLRSCQTQFLHRLVELGLGRDAVVPADLVLHVGDAFALDRMGDDAERLDAPFGRASARRSAPRDRGRRRRRRPSRKRGTCRRAARRRWSRRRARPVASVLRSMISARLASLWCPAAIAASQLLPSCNSPSPVMTKTRIVRLVELAREGDADGDRHAVAERAGVCFDAWDIVAVGMAVEHRHRLHVGRERIQPG